MILKKSLYRHLFLVDISKNARVTHFLIWDKDNSKTPCATRPQIGLRVAEARSCDIDESKKISGEPPHPILNYGAEKRRDHRNLPYAHAIYVIPPLLTTITRGVHRKIFFFDSSVSQLRASATLRPILGRVAQRRL